MELTVGWGPARAGYTREGPVDPPLAVRFRNELQEGYASEMRGVVSDKWEVERNRECSNPGISPLDGATFMLCLGADLRPHRANRRR